MKKIIAPSLLLMIIISATYFSCSKSDSTGNTPPPNPCTGITVAVSATPADATTGQSNGSITVTTTGGSGFTYQLGTGSFQSSGTFSNLAAGSYTITAKNSDGCTGSASVTVGTANPCAGTNISVAAITSNASPCTTAGDGSITVTASGSTGLTYSINGTSFQTSNIFSNVATGTYTVTVKNATGCSNTASVTVSPKPAGALFAAVKQVITANCTSCHSGGASASGGKDFTVDCNIANNFDRIKARAVDQAGTATQMPQGGAALSVADRQKITDWVAAGGKYTN
jgi:hypothetical protein